MTKRSTAARPGRLGRWAFRFAVLGLVGFNAWWLARDLWPLPTVVQAEALAGRGRLDEAESALREQVRRSPHDGRALSALGRVLYMKGDRHGAAEQLAAVPAWWPDRRAIAFHEGQILRELDLAARAEAAWRRCVADDPLHPVRLDVLRGAAKGLLEIYALEDRWDEARALIWVVEPQEPVADRPALLGKWLDTIFFQVDAREARETLRKFAAADSSDWNARRALARREEEAGDPAAADRQIRAVLAERPGDYHIWRDWLDILARRGDAVTLAATVRILPPSADADPAIWTRRGQVRLDAGDADGAVAALRRAADWLPFDSEALYRLAQAERRRGGSADEVERLRRRSEALKATRLALPAAAEAFRKAARGQAGAGEPDISGAAARIAELCDQLGWPRAAQSFRSLATPAVSP